MGGPAEKPREAAASELPLLLKVLMAFRVITVTLFLGVTVVVQLKGSQVLLYVPLYVVYLVIVAVYLATIFFAAIFDQVSNLPRFAKVQLGADLGITTLIIHLSGGYESPFPFLYLFSVLWASIALSGGGYWTASISSILYGAVVDLQYYGLLPATLDRALAASNPWDIFGRMAMHITAFFAVAFLGHQMARRYRTARLELSERTADLEALRSLSDLVFDSINSGIVVLDPSLRVRSLNAAARGILGLGDVPAAGRPVGELLPEIPIEGLCSRARLGQPNRWEGAFGGRWGRTRTLGLSISPLRPEGEGFVMIFQDLTDYRLMEGRLRAAEKLSALGRMAASIAHEVRNPLASMSGSIQILKESLPLREQDHRLMEIVLSETDRLNTLVGDFLSYARPQTPRFEEADLRELVEETVNLMAGVRAEGVTLDCLLPPRPLRLSVDSGQMRQVLINLVRNALEALDGAGRVEVGLSLEEGGPGGEPRTRLWVSDTGRGIPKRLLPEIFEPFKTSKPGGTGLGLAIVYQLVQIHQGTIDVQTEEGRGTTISVLLPPGR